MSTNALTSTCTRLRRARGERRCERRGVLQAMRVHGVGISRMRTKFFAALASIAVLAPAAPMRAQNQQPPTIAKVKELLSGTVRVNSIAVDGKTLNIAVND